jgi:chromosome segregation ATPase
MVSSRKRSRADGDSGDEHQSEHATSSFHQSAKRSRVAMAQERGGSTVSDDESEADLEYWANEIDEEDDDEQDMDEQLEDEDEEINETSASQYVQKGIRSQRENVASEYGVIEEVRCRNFMCHGNLRIKLGPLINFIIGHNGSGKSAVLTALTMCLGGKATATNRATSMKSLIKEGQENATLAVRIKNSGEGAYKPDLYGSSITVERNFSRSGASGFKIKNAEEKTITTKKADLDDILDYFAFQLDNPINVLTQDMARQFLSNSSPEEKYKFFIKGTQLETLDADYKLLEEHLDNMDAKLRSRNEDMAGLRQKAEDAEKKKKRLDASQAIQDNVSKTQKMHAWAQVEEVERSLDNFERDVTMQRQKIEEATARANDASGTYEGHNQAFEGAKNTLETLEANIADVESHWKEEKAAFDANTKELMDQRAQERRIKEDLKNHKANKTALEQEIAREDERLSGAEGPQQAQRLQRLEKLREAVVDVEQRQQDHAAQKAALITSREVAATEFEQTKPPLVEKSGELERISGLITRLQRDAGNKFAPFRPNMVQLVKAVDNETRWRTKPVGPMGLHVKLKRQEWSSQIETTFGGVLDSFICTNKEDQTLLSQIMKRVNCSVQIYIGPDRPLDTTGKEPDEGLLTILRAVEIDNDMVRNQLIINQSIEQTVLIPDSNEANAFMHGGTKPRNAKVAVAFSAERGGGLRYDFSRSGAPKSTPMKPWQGAPRMQTDRAEQIRRAKENEDYAKRELAQLNQMTRDAQNALKIADQALVRWERTNRDLRVEKQQADDSVEVVQNEIENNRPQDGKIQELRIQLQSMIDDVAATQRSYQDGVDWKDRLNALATGPDGLKAKADAALREYQTAKMQIEKAENKKTQLATDRERALREKNLALEYIDDARLDLLRAEEARDVQKASVETMVAAATRVCRRIPVEDGLTPAILDERLEKYIAEYARVQREVGGSKEELTMAFKVAKRAYHSAKDQLASMLDAKKVSSSYFVEPMYVTDDVAASQEITRHAPTSLEDVPQIHHLPRALHVRVLAFGAEIPWPRRHGPPRQKTRHQSRARHDQAIGFRPQNSDSVRRREVFLDHLLVARDLGGYGQPDSLFGRV